MLVDRALFHTAYSYIKDAAAEEVAQPVKVFVSNADADSVVALETLLVR